MPHRLRDNLKRQLAIVGVVGAVVAGGTLAIAGPTVGLLVVADSSVVSNSSMMTPSPDVTPSVTPAGSALPGTGTARPAGALEAGMGLLVLVGFASAVSSYLRKRTRKIERR